MTYDFPLASAKQKGYDQNQVNKFIELARVQFSDASLDAVTADSIRNVQFDLVPNGYLASAVDTAMDRLEDEFAAREVQRQKTIRGDSAVEDRLHRINEIVRGRTSRPNRQKFSSTGWWLRGYSRKQVDQFCSQIEQHLAGGTVLPVASVRKVVFTAKPGGYVEAQVDAFIDRVVEILQIEKNI